ncbi:MAG: response regulator transcription factor, partial [Comamonadaceae bacterium]
MPTRTPKLHRESFSVLVVNDNLAQRYAVARSLRDAGYMTMEAASGAEALEFGEYVAAVVLDIHLPDVEGFEVCRLLRRNPKTSALPIIHLTARHVTVEDERASRASGAAAYFTSSVTPEVLVCAIDN